MKKPCPSVIDAAIMIVTSRHLSKEEPHSSPSRPSLSGAKGHGGTSALSIKSISKPELSKQWCESHLLLLSTLLNTIDSKIRPLRDP